MGVKDFYLNLEEKWYSIWERIDSKIPVYGIIDRIDSIIPSFALFLLIILFLIFFLFIGFYFSMSPLQASFKIIDYENKPVEDSIINFSIIENGNTIREENIRTNNLGEIIINELNIGQEIIVDINLSKGTSKSTFIVPAGGLNETIKLKQKIVFQSIERNIYLEYKNASVQEAIRMDFFCENNTIIPNPTTSYSQQGTLKIVEPVNCIRLFGKIISDEYEN
ncbi:MAG: hypothetical protein PHX27_02075, partial [Candidatus ainarchaeum sp.]|nr:hypothetical protein [Candidatus ainarchaeum sp.]